MWSTLGTRELNAFCDDCTMLILVCMRRSAHASAAPWEAQNALDAAFLAYSAISVLRQQIKPTHRVHGIVEGKEWAPNSEF
jgi:metal-dependent amidase/aminoacylase/carboxypeptidase family protein